MNYGKLRDADVSIEVDGEAAYGFITDVEIQQSFHGDRQILFRGRISGDLNRIKMREKFCSDLVTIDYNGCAREKINQPTIMKDSIFYMNWMDNGGAPTHPFVDRADAEKEAARLAHAHQRPVYTLQAVVCTEPQVNVTKTELKEKALAAPAVTQ
jgi:hypothetical protein